MNNETPKTRCSHLGPRIPMVQHERPTCCLEHGHSGAHEDFNGFEWPSELQLLKAKNQQLAEALRKFVTAAKSWHDTHGHGSNPVQCDWLCECIAPAEAALKAHQP